MEISNRTAKGRWQTGKTINKSEKRQNYDPQKSLSPWQKRHCHSRKLPPSRNNKNFS
jgi:hypothetical protein